MSDRTLGSSFPEIALQLHPTKNGNLTAYDIKPSDKTSVWWKMPYDVPEDYPIEHLRGKHFDFEWKASVYHRIYKSDSCPYLSGKAIWPGFNDLQTLFPNIATDWNYDKNKGLKNKFGKDISTPDRISPWSNIKVWWKMSYDVPDDYPIEHLRGRHFDFEWEAPANSRVSGKSFCPFLDNGGGTHAVYLGFNDLATTHPDIALQWHPTKNGDLNPQDVTSKSHKKVWWLYPYDDPDTGKHFDFEWKSVIKERINSENICPFLGNNNPQVWKGFNDLQTLYPEIAAQWHPTKNKNLKPSDVTSTSHIKVWWLYPYDDPDTGKHFDFEWEASINNRVLKKADCPFINTGGGSRNVWVGYNDFATTHPDLAEQMHPTKNGNILPTMFTAGSKTDLWWICDKGHEWKISVVQRTTKKSQCPVCNRERKTSFPEQAVFYYMKQHFPDAVTGDRTTISPYELDVYIPSKGIAIEYDGEAYHFDETKDILKNKMCCDKDIILFRIRENQCCDINTDNCNVFEYDYKNINGLEIIIRLILKVLGVDETDVNIERDRQAIYSQYIFVEKKNSLAIKYPDIAKQLHPTKNNGIIAENISYGSGKSLWWKCHICGHEWLAPVCHRTRDSASCPKCLKLRIKKNIKSS